jgi:hypothetical protein
VASEKSSKKSITKKDKDLKGGVRRPNRTERRRYRGRNVGGREAPKAWSCSPMAVLTEGVAKREREGVAPTVYRLPQCIKITIIIVNLAPVFFFLSFTRFLSFLLFFFCSSYLLSDKQRE